MFNGLYEEIAIFGSATVGSLMQVPSVPAQLVAALDAAADDAPVASDLALVVAALTVASDLLDVTLMRCGVVPALLRQLPHNPSHGVALARCEVRA